MSDVLKKLDRLLALAASANEHEARNAAVLACRLIREKGLVVTEPAGVRGREAGDPTVRDWVNDIFDPRYRSTVNDPYAGIRHKGEKAPPRVVVDEVKREGSDKPADLDELLRKGAQVLDGFIPKGRR